MNMNTYLLPVVTYVLTDVRINLPLTIKILSENLNSNSLIFVSCEDRKMF